MVTCHILAGFKTWCKKSEEGTLVPKRFGAIKNYTIVYVCALVCLVQENKMY